MKILYVLTVFLMLYLTVLYQSISLCALFLLLLFLPFFGFLQLFLLSRNLTVLFPDSVLNNPGEPRTAFSIQIKNSGILPAPRVKGVLKLTDLQKNTVASFPLEFSLKSHETRMFPITLSSSLYGRFLCQMDRLRIYSCFSLFCQKKPLFSSIPVLFYPDPSPISLLVSEYTRYFPAEGTDSDEILFGPCGLPREQIRSFLPGDKLKQIHWKLSARSEELLVREEGKPDSCAVLFFLQLTAPSAKNAAVLYSCFLECAASLSFALCEQFCNHYMIWYDPKTEQLVRCPVKKQEDWNLFLHLLLHASLYEGEKDLFHFYQAAYPSDLWCTSLELSVNLKFSKNGQPLASLSITDWSAYFRQNMFTV